VNGKLGQKLGMGGAGYPHVYRQFVAFYSGDIYVLDLKSDSFVAVSSTHTGAEDMSGSELGVEQSSSAKGDKTVDGPWDETAIDLAELPDLPGCS
jgi:hypothetical protein